MKCRPDDMVLLQLDYGDLTRPSFTLRRERWWSQATNHTPEILIVYGPKHETDRSVFDTSPYVLKPGCTTPDAWDCKGFFVPADRRIQPPWGRSRPGPVAAKYWDFRSFSVQLHGETTYACPWTNGIYQPSQINWALPNLLYDEIVVRVRAAL